ncbi:hypothetical protein [Amycolatopsis jejuensis]|uniref:hypothetical protein n=1 Tax=Amycolatopsis jejuensis TaxID=330084 RepID=UPI00138E28EE|nr:hypothetical protein [Amycolatopsis jejuensis]
MAAREGSPGSTTATIAPSARSSSTVRSKDFSTGYGSTVPTGTITVTWSKPLA